MHFDWQSQYKEQIENCFNVLVRGEQIDPEEKKEIIPLLQDEGATLHCSFGKHIISVKPLINADAWLWNLFVRRDCKPENADAAIKFLLNDVVSTAYHRKQTYDFMKTALMEHYGTQPQLMCIKLYRLANVWKEELVMLPYLLQREQLCEGKNICGVMPFIHATPLKLFKYLYSDEAQTISNEHRQKFALWALQHKDFECSRLASHSWTIVYNRGDKEVVNVLAEKDSRVAKQLAHYEQIMNRNKDD